MRRKARPGGGRQVEVTIETLGGRGDGVAQFEGRPVYVPLVLPGERVRLRLTGDRAGAYRGEVTELIEASPERVEAPCPHFGPCGGCALQHQEPALTHAWKGDQVRAALARRGLPDDAVRPLVAIPPGSRRRATLAALKNLSGVVLGFHGRSSDRIEDADGCLLLTPGLAALLPALRVALGSVLGAGQRASITLTETTSGVDLLLVTEGALGLAGREALAALAETADLARLSWAAPGAEPEPVVLRRAPSVIFSGVPVEPPPGGFLQPSAAGEAALVERVLAALPDGAGQVADLYAGCGTFTFALAERARTLAVEGEAVALAALWSAARRAGLAGRVEVEARDLARQPLDPGELEAFDCVVFDPPRAGAREQAAAIAASSLPAAVAVSCNPNTFARDARILVDGGFTLEQVTPVDQFPWSGHVELVASFRR